MGLVAVEGDVDPADAEQGEAVAVVGARVGTIVAMDGAGVADPDTALGPPPGLALGCARVGAAPAMHAAAEFAVNCGGPAGAARAGAGAAAGGEVAVAAAFLVAGGGESKTAGSAGAAAVKAACVVPVLQRYF